MNNLSRVLGLPLFLALAALLMLSSCASAKKEHPMGFIKKANHYHLKPGMVIETADPSIRFEYMHRIYGAVESEEYVDRYGHYIDVSWQGVEDAANVKLRMEYRQANTGSTLQTKELVPDKVRWRNTTNFDVTGAEYATGGPVTSWRVVLLVNGAEADTYESFLWK